MTHRSRLAMIVVAALTQSACLHRDRPITGVSTGAAVLIADVRNETGDTTFDRGLLEAARVALQQSAHVRMHPRSRVPETYRLMQITDPRTPLTYELAQEVAERESVRFVLGLFISRVGVGHVLTARIADVPRHATVAEVSESFSTPDRVIGALDRVMGRTRRILGESTRSIAERRQSLPRVVTGSIGALRSYSDGSTAWMQARYDEARELFHRAVELDTGFAMAYGALGSYYYYFRDRERGERYLGEALARSERLTEWERLRLTENHLHYRGKVDSAIVISGVMTQRFPSVLTWYDYGTSLMNANRDREAMLALSRALELDSTFVNAWINLATVYKGQGRFKEAVESYREAERHDSTALYRNFINHEYGGALIQNGQSAEARGVYERMAASTALGNKQFGYRSLGYLALWEGRVHDAVSAYQQAIETAQQQREPLSEARNRLLLASVYRTLNRLGDASAQVTRVLVLSDAPTVDPSFMGPVAFELGQLERLTDLDSLVSRIRARAVPHNRAHQSALALATALTQLGRRRADSALASLGMVSHDYGWRVIPLLARAEAFEMSGQRDSLLATLRILEGVRAYGREGQGDWMRVPLLIGDELARRGDSAGAVQSYEAMIARWRGAPADLPDLVAARSRLSALTGGR